MENKIAELDVNNLVYVPSTPVELSINRVLRKFYPDKNNFGPNEKMVIRLRGNQFLDMKNSSLTLKFYANQNVNFGTAGHHGSVVNLFNRVRVLTSTGKVISDVLENHLLQRMLTRMDNNPTLFNVIGPSFGFNYNQAAGSDFSYTIPLRMISPFFDNEQLLPPRIAEGLTIELYLNSFNNLGYTPVAVTDYEVKDVQLLADVVVMDDSVTQLINGMINETLVYEYTDWLHQSEFMSASQNDSLLVFNRPCSNALESITILRDSAKVTSPTESSYNTIPIQVHQLSSDDDEVRFRSGEVDLPQQPARGGSQIYNLLLNGKGVLSHSNPNFAVTLDEFNSITSTGCWANYFCNLRTSRIIDNSGREISNQQNFSVYVKSKQIVGLTGIMDTFVKYIGRIVINAGFCDVEI